MNETPPGNTAAPDQGLDVAAEYEAMLDFMYQVPVGLVQTAEDGMVEMINPTSARLLLPVSRSGRLANLFDAFEAHAPQLRGLVTGFPANSGTICENLHVDIGMPVRGSGMPQVLCLTLIRLRPGRLMAVVSDVSVAADNERRLRESEAFSNRIIDTAPDAIIVVDDEGRMARVNRRAEQTFGYGREELLRQPVEMLMPEPARGRHGELRRAFMAEPEQFPAVADPTVPRLVAGRRKDGSEFAVEAGLGRVEMGQKFHAVAMLRDVTDREEARAALKRLNGELEERVETRTRELRKANADLESFSYTLAHDLRTPLRAISGFTSLLRSGDAANDPESAAMLGHITSAAQRMSRQIDGLLALSQIAHTELRASHIDLSALAAAVVAELRQLDPERSIGVRIADNMACRGDATLLQVVLQNLLGNAWKYTGQTTYPIIRFDARERDGVTEYCVADNGAGFDMSHAGRLFEAFQRMHRQDEFPGVGIGLATVRRIIERHGGRIRAESSPGAGARFFFTLGAALPPAAG